ncbi:hypothetical protein PoB_000824800 [Plakobranchus ocellatus]|uniref:Uncharacterized protein n=1 Tax=Plakobranchus ocellatus TaxID=259542 RepID=A0AAV3YHU6_9GAST|nr:hypothetical protein PoB_000824800 [Plakobranchus ocellatus]
MVERTQARPCKGHSSTGLAWTPGHQIRNLDRVLQLVPIMPRPVSSAGTSECEIVGLKYTDKVMLKDRATVSRESSVRCPVSRVPCPVSNVRCPAYGVTHSVVLDLIIRGGLGNRGIKLGLRIRKTRRL